MKRADVLKHVLALAESVDDVSDDEMLALSFLRDEYEELVDEEPGVVLSAGRWRNNAELIVDVARLYYQPSDVVVDLTYGKGKFWSSFQPERFTAHDLDPAKGDGVDWGALPEASGSVDIAVWDAPYVAPGGRDTSTIADMNDRFGMHLAAKDPDTQWVNICRGFPEVARVLRVGGLVWFKCMNYVTSGRVFWFTHDAVTELLAHGFEIEAEFIHIGGTGPQPKTNRDGSPRRQVHPRNNSSRLIVARKLPPPPPELFGADDA